MPLPQNHLLARLPRKERLGLLAQCETVQLVLGEVLCEEGAVVHHAYFPVDGFISLLTRIEAHPSLEVGMVGREGMFGAGLVLGVNTSPLQAIVQGAGSAWRVGSTELLAALQVSPALRRTLLSYVYVKMDQMGSAAACLRFHLIGPRLARWLLMSQDRAQADTFHVTQEFLACMLGVRRVGVTTAAGVLQRNGLIQYHRGELTVLDRPGLEAAACSCYATDRESYKATMV